jgi:hypothetical protein
MRRPTMPGAPSGTGTYAMIDIGIMIVETRGDKGGIMPYRERFYKPETG